MADRRIRISDDDVRQMRTLRDCGWTVRKLAELFDVSRSQAGRIILGYARVSPQRWSPACEARVVHLRTRGWTIRAIARTMQMHRATVRRILDASSQ
jgi:plasmid maintenance system antidote protein VapI